MKVPIVIMYDERKAQKAFAQISIAQEAIATKSHNPMRARAALLMAKTEFMQAFMPRIQS